MNNTKIKSRMFSLLLTAVFALQLGGGLKSPQAAFAQGLEKVSSYEAVRTDAKSPALLKTQEGKSLQSKGQIMFDAPNKIRTANPSVTQLNSLEKKRMQNLQDAIENKSSGVRPLYHENLIYAIVVDENMYMEAGDYVNIDVYIAPGAALLIMGDAEIDGDVINYGVIGLAAQLEAQDVYAVDFLEYYEGMDLYNGDIYDLGGGTIYSLGIQSIYDLSTLPIQIYSSNVKNSAGRLPLVEGAVLPIFDLKLEAQPVALESNGSFTLNNYYVGSKTQIKFTIISIRNLP